MGRSQRSKHSGPLLIRQIRVGLKPIQGNYFINNIGFGSILFTRPGKYPIKSPATTGNFFLPADGGCFPVNQICGRWSQPSRRRNRATQRSARERENIGCTVGFELLPPISAAPFLRLAGSQPPPPLARSELLLRARAVSEYISCRVDWC